VASVKTRGGCGEEDPWVVGPDGGVPVPDDSGDVDDVIAG
jgi:hypothetical protein